MLITKAPVLGSGLMSNEAKAVDLAKTVHPALKAKKVCKKHGFGV